MKRAALFAILALAACRAESQPPAARDVAPPVDSPASIPAGPVSGTLRGAPFAVKDARVIVDKRQGYAHTDIVLSASAPDAPCGRPADPKAASVWLRLEGPAEVEAGTLRLDTSGKGPWSVHYQVFEGPRWTGVGTGAALVSLQPAADGRLQGGLAVCFSDDTKSCASGSFQATPCPSHLDEPVRGAPPLEKIPESYRLRVEDAGLPRGR